MILTYGSVCSGIEAATVAWHPMGHIALWFAQFDPEHNYKRGPDFLRLCWLSAGLMFLTWAI
jgi:DNA (cytosine-5)-methyltransferase 1